MGRRLLLVEGKDDIHVVRHLCKAHGIDIASVEIAEPADHDGDGEGGVQRLLEQVPVRLKESDLERLGVVLDADQDLEARWAQLRDRLRRAGYAGVPDRPASEGTVVVFQHELCSIRFGVWLMPNNRLPGMLEDFLAFLVSPDDRMMPRVDGFLASIPSEDRVFPLPKARIHSYLAVQKEPGKPLGLAITCGYLNARQETVYPFLNWLRTVLV